MKMNFGGLESFFLFWVIWFIVIAVVQIAFAVAVYRDAEDIANSGEKVVFVPSPIWLLATLIGGVFVAATYWLIHHSTLNPRNSVNKKATDEIE